MFQIFLISKKRLFVFKLKIKNKQDEKWISINKLKFSSSSLREMIMLAVPTVKVKFQDGLQLHLEYSFVSDAVVSNLTKFCGFFFTNDFSIIGVHRQLGVHITKVKSVNLDKWPDGKVDLFRNVSNAMVNAYFEKNKPSHQ